MNRLTLRSLWEHKRRLVSTVVAVVLGVAFMSGTFVLSDTIDKVFDDLFADANEAVDAQVQGPVTFEIPFGGGDSRDRIDEGLATVVAGVDGVASAAPYVYTEGGGANNIVLGADGDALGIEGPPTLLESWIDDPDLNPYDIAEGRPPGAPNELVLDVHSTEDGDLAVGDTVRVLTQFGQSEYTLVGTLTFGGEDSLGGVVSANFTLAEAQRLAGVDGMVDTIVAAADDGVSQQELVDRIGPAVPTSLEVITGEEAAKQGADSVQEGFSFFKILLTLFGAIALVVGAFIITNTFAILVAQRTRELALLRALGASKGQVLRSVLLEAVIIGLVAAVLGLLGGIGLATLAKGIFAGSIDMPSLVVSPNTAGFALLAGLLITVLSAIVPAWRATRVPPLAALREVAIDRSGASKARAVVGALVLLFGIVNLVTAYAADETESTAAVVGFSALLLLIGAIVLGPVVAGPSVRLLGGLLPRFKGVTGRLAMENAARSPKRTSVTAASLIIAVALVGFITVFAASAKASITDQVDGGLEADLIVQPETSFTGGFGGLPGGLIELLQAVPGVDVATGTGFNPGEIIFADGDTSTTFISTAEPTELAQVLDPKMVEGELTDLTDGGVLVDTIRAERAGIEIGDQLTVRVPQGGSIELTVQGISDDPNVLGYYTVTRDDFASISTQAVDFFIYLGLADGADLATVQEAAKEAVSGSPNIDVLDRDQFRDDIVSQFTSILQLIYALLALSILISVIGIGNTLSLSIHERTRELGLLRAVGMIRSQVRSAIRWEAVLISVLGTLVGLVLGLVLSRSMVQALRNEGLGTFALPVGSLVIIVLGAAALGVLASLRPSQRASKLDILDAIARD